MPKISIIVTAYNQEKYIWEAIESLKNQTFKDWEMIVWDDCSKDNTYEVAKKHSQNDDRIKVYWHKENLWIAWNMKFLFEKVSSDSKYIAFLEWDDIYHPENLETKINIFEKDSKIDLIYNQYNKIDWDWKLNNDLLHKLIWFFKSRDRLQKITLDDLILRNIIHTFSFVMMKKENINTEIFEKFEKSFIPVDYYFWLNNLPNKTIFRLWEKLSDYRVHSNNTSKNYEKHFNDTIKCLEEFNKTIYWSNIEIFNKIEKYIELKRIYFQVISLLINKKYRLVFKNTYKIIFYRGLFWIKHKIYYILNIIIHYITS